MKYIALLLMLVFSFNAKAAEDPATYYVPPPQFNTTLRVMDQGFANVFAFFQNATGSFSFDEAGKSLSHLKLAIDATSLTSPNAGAARDLSGLLGIMQYSEIRITAPDAVTFADGKPIEIKANITLHGTTKPITLTASLNHVGKSPHGGGMWASGGDAVGLSLRGTIKRTDFGMGDDPEVPGRFGDSFYLMLEIQGLKQ